MQVQPGSIKHVFEHPSPGIVFPSSHYSPIVLVPSPQIYEQVQGSVRPPPEHVQPRTGPEQSALQDEVPSFPPSSQISPNTLFPSPQIAMHVEGFGVLKQFHPVSIAHNEEHPSRSSVFPSSHGSETVTTPSPHTYEQVLGVDVDPPEQVYPDAGPEQSALQFVESNESPSSQISPTMFLPSPHIGVQTEVGPAVHVQPTST